MGDGGGIAGERHLDDGGAAAAVHRVGCACGGVADALIGDRSGRVAQHVGPVGEQEEAVAGEPGPEVDPRRDVGRTTGERHDHELVPSDRDDPAAVGLDQVGLVDAGLLVVRSGPVGARTGVGGARARRGGCGGALDRLRLARSRSGRGVSRRHVLPGRCRHRHVPAVVHPAVEAVRPDLFGGLFLHVGEEVVASVEGFERRHERHVQGRRRCGLAAVVGAGGNEDGGRRGGDGEAGACAGGAGHRGSSRVGDLGM